MSCRISASRCETVPVPCEATASVPGLAFANAISFYYYRPILELLSIGLRLRRGKPREVEHADDCRAIRRTVEERRSAFLFLRTQRLKTFLRGRKSEKRRDEARHAPDLRKSLWRFRHGSAL